jgi:hypothetical protein
MSGKSAGLSHWYDHPSFSFITPLAGRNRNGNLLRGAITVTVRTAFWKLKMQIRTIVKTAASYRWSTSSCTAARPICPPKNNDAVSSQQALREV